jgi:glycerol-3-phosphate cytidylyltransferase
MKKKKVIGFTCGAFDLLHAGHALMLEECREYCDELIVGLQSDPSIDRPEKNKPIQTFEERLIMLRSIKWVDGIVFYDTEQELYDLLEATAPDVRIVGADWEGKEFTGHDLSIPIVFNSRDHGYSTSDLRQRVFYEESNKRS